MTLQNETVLVVDDDEIQLEITEDLLQSMGVQHVVKARDGMEQALEIMQQHPIDAATLDFHMAGINGIELLRSVRNLQPAAKYVLLTADSHETIAREATTLGALYCPKPLNNAQLDRILRYFQLG